MKTHTLSVGCNVSEILVEIPVSDCVIAETCERCNVSALKEIALKSHADVSLSLLTKVLTSSPFSSSGLALYGQNWARKLSLFCRKLEN